MLKARELNFQRYHFQGIGRYAPDAAYARGLADLKILADIAIPAAGYTHGARPTSIDAGIYGFIANIYFYNVDTPLKQFVSSQPNLVRHCTALHDAVTNPQRAQPGWSDCETGASLDDKPALRFSLRAGYEGAGVSLDPPPSPGAIRV